MLLKSLHLSLAMVTKKGGNYAHSCQLSHSYTKMYNRPVYKRVLVIQLKGGLCK